MPRLFTNCSVLDGRGGRRPKGWVLIDDKKIVSVGDGEGPPSSGGGGLEIVDLGGKTLMPGLIDAHVHLVLDGGPDVIDQINEPLSIQVLKGARHARQALSAGITTVRDMGAKGGVVLHLRQAVESGLVRGSGIIASGHVICMTGGHGWFFGRESDGPDEVRKNVRREIKAGADCVKLIATGGVLTPGVNPSFAQLSYAELRAGIEEAHKAGRKTATHAQGEQGIANAVKAGIDSVEHGYYLTEELIEIMLGKGIYLVPTITSLTNIVDNAVDGGIPDWAVDKARTVIVAARQSHAKARQAGVRIAMGTDAGTPYNLHGRNGNELVAMVEWGFSPMEAIVAATSNAADLLGLSDSVGTIEEGKMADLVVVDGDPLKDIGLLGPKKGIEAVYKSGQLVSNEWW